MTGRGAFFKSKPCRPKDNRRTGRTPPATAPLPRLNRAPPRVKRKTARGVREGSCMIRFVFRFVGLWILAAAFVALIRDGTIAIASNTLDLTKLGRLGDDWNNIPGASLDTLNAMAERYVGASVWEFVSVYVLGAPTWVVLGIVGSIFILIGRKRKPLIGYGRD